MLDEEEKWMSRQSEALSEKRAIQLISEELYLDVNGFSETFQIFTSNHFREPRLSLNIAFQLDLLPYILVRDPTIQLI